MPAPQPLYDLVLLLDGSADDKRRAAILESVQSAVKKDGEVVNEQDWGARALAYEIRHRKDAEYHLLQFHGPAELLAQLDRTLRITDEVVRFRIIKLAPGTPAPPEQRSEPRPAAAGYGDGVGEPAAGTPSGADEGEPAPAAGPADTEPTAAEPAAAEEPAEEPVAVAAGEPADAEPAAEDASAADEN